MASKDSGAKWISRNRAPRVQIQYDCEVLSEPKREIPFVMGVMADLSGDAKKPNMKKREFTEVDVDNLDDYMRSLNPELEFSKNDELANTITGEGFLEANLKFEKMQDFTPGAIANQIPAVRKLMEARSRLSSLAAYTDGKDDAEELLRDLLTKDDSSGFANEQLLQELVNSAKEEETKEEA